MRRRPVLGWAVAACAAAARPAAAEPGPMDLIPGVVVRLDTESGFISVRHGPIAHLRLAAGTTRLRFVEARYVVGLRDGDAILFRVDRIDGTLRLTSAVRAPRASQ